MLNTDHSSSLSLSCPDADLKELLAFKAAGEDPTQVIEAQLDDCFADLGP